MEIDVAARRLTWANAGQVYPMLRRGDEVRELEAPSYPLGVRRQASYELRHHDLEPGDLIVVFTDGYVEAISPAGELFGWDRMRRRLEQLTTNDPERIVTELSEALHEHLGKTHPQDDVTLVAIGVER